MNTNNNVMWVILPNNTDLDCFKILTSQEILKIQNQLLEEHCACSGVIHLFQLVGCARNRLLFLSSTESEIISLDTGLRFDGLPALELWDLTVSVLGNVSRVSDGSGKPESDVHKHHKSHKKIDVMKDIDAVSFKCPILASRSFIVCV